MVAESDWVEALAAAGPKEASREKRKDFAYAVISRLPGAYERGRFAENAFDIRKRFAAASESLRLSLMSFHDMVATDPVAAAHLGFNLDELVTVAGPLCTYLEQIARCGADQECNDAYSSRKPPGRKIRIAIAIAEMVALAYYQHFGKMPGKSKQATVNTPFFQVCRVVRRILRACGHTGFSIGDQARNSGIERAKVMVEYLAIIRATQPDTKPPTGASNP